MTKPILGAQLYSLRELLENRSEEEIRNVLKEVKSMGFEAVEIAGVGKITKELVHIYLKACQDYNLDICSTHTSLENLEEDIDWIIEYHKLWNCTNVGIGAMPQSYRNESGYTEFIKICNDISRKLNTHGLQLFYHNHRFEFEKYNGQTGINLLLDNFENVKFELDTYWVQAGGGNPIDWLNKLGGHIDIVHLKDMAIVEDQPTFADVGSGNLNWDSILDTCHKIGIRYLVVEKDTCEGNPLDSIRKSIQYLKTKNI